MLVYIDLLMLLNYLVDYLLILGTNRLTGYPPGCRNAAKASLLGAIYAAICVLPGFQFLSSMLWRVVSLIIISGLAFGWNRQAVRRYAVFILLSMALGGIASGTADLDFIGLLLFSGLLWLMCGLGAQDNCGKDGYIHAELRWHDRIVHLTALKDTGNMLRDPLTGEQVLVCGADVGEELLGLKRSQIQNPLETLTSGVISGLRVIPYHTVGNNAGLMLAVRLKQAKIGDTTMDPLVAFAPEEIARGEEYRMLTGGTV